MYPNLFSNANNLVCIRIYLQTYLQIFLSLNSRMFQTKMLHQFVKDSFKDSFSNANNLVCIRIYLQTYLQIFLSLNSRMFQTKMLHQFVKDSFIVPSISAIKNFNMFLKNLVYPKTFHLNSFLLLTSTSLKNL